MEGGRGIRRLGEAAGEASGTEDEFSRPRSSRREPEPGGTQISVLVESPRKDWLLTLALVRNSTSQTHGAPVWNHEEGASTLSFSRSPLNNDVST